jgi:hypothetical protein
MQPSKTSKTDAVATGRPKKTSSIAAAADALVAAAALKDGGVRNRPESWSPASLSDSKALSSAPTASSSKALTGIQAVPVDLARPANNTPDSRKAPASAASQVLSGPESAVVSKSIVSLPVAKSETTAKPNTQSNPPTLSASSSFLSSITPSTFADEAFDMDSFLLRAATSNTDIHSLPPSDLRAFLLTLLDSVTQMETQSREDLQNNESSYSEVESIRSSEVEACENELEEMLERLRALTSSVSNIWGKSRGIADLLITADRQRTRAIEAVEIIEWFERIKEERLLTVHKEIINPTACWGFAHLVHGLAAFARDLRVSGCATAVADVQQLEELFERCHPKMR